MIVADLEIWVRVKHCRSLSFAPNQQSLPVLIHSIFISPKANQLRGMTKGAGVDSTGVGECVVKVLCKEAAALTYPIKPR